jgi:hypothetical protein
MKKNNKIILINKIIVDTIKMESYGLNAAINQSDEYSTEAAEKDKEIRELNNQNTKIYNKAVRDAKTFNQGQVQSQKISDLQSKGLLIGGIGVNAKLRIGKYSEAVESGKIGPGLGGSKVISSLKSGGQSAIDSVGSAGRSAGNALSSVSEAAGRQTARMGLQGRGAKFAQLSEDGRTGGLNTDIPQGTSAEPVEPVEPTPVEPAPAADSAVTDGVETDVKAEAKGAGEFAGRALGGVVSVVSLGGDITEQVKEKKFFAGENTGDKIGNFLNEAGSLADIGGLVTADPFLAMAGVGVSLLGAGISEVSELFGTPKVKPAVPPPKKPKVIVGESAPSIAGQGGIAESGLSTLNQVQSGY